MITIGHVHSKGKKARNLRKKCGFPAPLLPILGDLEAGFDRATTNSRAGLIGAIPTSERVHAGSGEDLAMELASIILRRSLGALGTNRSSCSSCRRTPVAGELMHVFESDRVLCSLCLAHLPEEERAPLRSERVHVSERRIAVVPKAA